MAQRRIRLPPPPRLPPVFERDESHTMVDDFTLRAARHRARQAPPIPPVFCLPLRKHPMWSGNNEIGRETLFAPDANNRQMIIKMEEWDEPISRTISLGLDYSDSAFAPGVSVGFQVTAEIVIGVGGASQTFEVDWVQGSSFTVTANAINVTAKYSNADAVPSDLRLSALIAKGKGPSRPPTRTFFVPAIAAGALEISDPIRIPAFARSVMLYDRSANVGIGSAYNATTRLVLTANNTTGGGQQEASILGSQLLSFAGNGFPVPDRCRAFRIINTDAANQLVVNAIFQLAF